MKLIHERPAVIQELEWPIWLAGGSSPQTDPVKTILFSSYNGQLFRIAINYDRNETEGLTTGDMIEAISAKYGTPTKPANTEIAFLRLRFTTTANPSGALANTQYSFNLYRSSSYSQATFRDDCFLEESGCPGPDRDHRSYPAGCANGASARDPACQQPDSFCGRGPGQGIHSLRESNHPKGRLRVGGGKK